jgi:hypothetical protein
MASVLVLYPGFQRKFGFYEAGYFWLLQDTVTPVESMVMDSPISFAEILGWIPYMWMGHFARIAVLGEAVWMGKT